MRRVLRLSISACIILFSTCMLGQDLIKIYGPVKFDDTNKKIVGANVTVMSKGSVVDELVTTGNGKWEFELDLGEIYRVKFEFPGYMPKIIEYNVKNISEEDKIGGFISQCEVNLMKEIEGFDLSILDNPVGKFSYHAVKDAIDYDEDHSDRMRQRIDDEIERLEELAANAGKMQKQFDDLVAKGDQKVMQEKYTSAVEKYDAALEIFPEDAPVLKKRDDAQTLADELSAAGELEQQYQSLISSGSSKMKKEEWEDAREDFVEASQIKPSEKLPKDKIDQIDDILASLADRDKYDEVLASADDYFESEDYALCIEKYEEAIRLIPSEKYPKTQKAEAERILKEIIAGLMDAEELQKRYDDLIVLADRNFKDKDYKTAKRKYQDASNLKKEERHPIDRIEECDELLSELEEAASASADADAVRAERERIDKEYAALIEKANDKFDKDNLESARADYVEASELKSDEKFPPSRISRIDELLEERTLADENSKITDRSDELAAADELARQQREERQRLAEEERKRRMSEESSERDRIAAERARKDEEDRNRRSRWLSNVDTTKEDEVEKYYREARESEEKAKAKAIEAKKNNLAGFVELKTTHADEIRGDNLNRVNSSKDLMDVIHREGEAYMLDKKQKNSNKKEAALEYQHGKSSDADSQRRRNENRTDEKKKNQEAVAHQDIYREQRMDEHNRDVESYDQKTALYASKSETILTDMAYEVGQEKKVQDKVIRNGEKYRGDRIAGVQDDHDRTTGFMEDTSTAADERLASASSKKNRKKETFEKAGVRKDEHRQDRMLSVNEDKRKVEEFNASKELDSQNSRFDKRTELFSKDGGNEKNVDDYHLPEGAEDLSEGVTENSYQQGNKIVIERIVRVGNKVENFRKVVSKTGTYYFKDNQSITEQVWRRETVDQRD